MAWTYKSNLESIIDYSGASKTARRAGIKSNNDVYFKIKDVDDRLKKYFNEVERVMLTEIKYGFNIDAVRINGVAMDYQQVRQVFTYLDELKKERKQIKKKIKIEVLKRRLHILEIIVKSFENANSDDYSKVDKSMAEGELRLTRQRLNETE